MKQGLQVLLLDANSEDARVVSEVVRSAGLQLHVRADGTSALEAFRQLAPDLVLIDSRLGESERARLSSEIRRSEHGRSTPIVLLRGDTSEPSHGPSLPRSGNGPDQTPGSVSPKELLGALSNMFPNAFLTTSQPNRSGATASPSPNDTVVTASPSATALPSVASFEEEDLGELLDMVFPEGDSGSLASELASAHSAQASTAAPADPLDSPLAPKPSLLDPPPPMEAAVPTESKAESVEALEPPSTWGTEPRSTPAETMRFERTEPLEEPHLPIAPSTELAGDPAPARHSEPPAPEEPGAPLLHRPRWCC
jgi:CheY-like chemotaxis protein